MSYESHRSQNEALVAAWDARTAGLEPESPIIPIHVLLGDAVDLAAFVETHHSPRELNGAVVPGLESVEKESGVTLETARELMELQAAIAHVQAELESRRRRAGSDPLARADELIAKIRAGLVFLLDGEEHAADAVALRELRLKARRSRAHDHVAVTLEGFVSLAARHLERLESVGVSRSVLREALDEAAALRARSADRIRGGAVTEYELRLRVRNRLVAALNARIRLVRRAARFVYRDHPEIVRRTSSGYVRPRSRAEAARGPAEIQLGEEETTVAA